VAAWWWSRLATAPCPCPTPPTTAPPPSSRRRSGKYGSGSSGRQARAVGNIIRRRMGGGGSRRCGGDCAVRTGQRQCAGTLQQGHEVVTQDFVFAACGWIARNHDVIPPR